jgi:GT2 family glycosyltransferase
MGEAPAPQPRDPQARLTVSVVSHFSNPRALENTLLSLAKAIDAARSAGVLGQSSVTLVDNSEDPEQARLLNDLLKLPSLAQQNFSLLTDVPNQGYGAAHNRVIRDADSDFHLILNPDVTLDVNAIGKAVEALDAHPSCVLLTPHTVDASGCRQHVAKSMPGILTLVARATPRLPGWLRDRLGNARYELRSALDTTPAAGRYLAGGCFMFCRTHALKTVGGFDERYFMYFEDFDLSLRLASADDRILYEPSVAIVHGGGGAASKGLRHILWFGRSALRFFNRHGWRWMS